MKHGSLRHLLVALAAVLVVAACTGDDDGATITEAPQQPEITSAPTEVAGDPTTTTSTTVPGPETHPVEIEGADLPTFEAEHTDPSQDPAVGTPAPVVSGVDFAGFPVTLGGGDGPYAVVFLAHWCPHCQSEVRQVQPLLDATGDMPVPGVEILSVVTSIDEDMDNYPPSAWLYANGWTPPVLRDSEDNEAHQAYGYGGFPYWVFVDADGMVARRSAGELDMAQLEEYLAEIAPDVA